MSGTIGTAVPGRARPTDQHQRRTGAAIVSKDSSGDRAIQRDLSLTWAADLPPGNALTAGSWWSPQPSDDIPGVSVEAKVAESLKLKLNDHLVFTSAGSIVKRGSPACAPSTGTTSSPTSS
jgi:predicted lysophospholipase L1 biosynthesis ABC-type transport system permease subunit